MTHDQRPQATRRIFGWCTTITFAITIAFLKERMNQVKNRYAEYAEQRSYKSIFKATQVKNSNIYNQIKCVLEYSKNICKE